MSDTHLQTEARELIAFYDERGWNWESALGFVRFREMFGRNFLIIDRTEFDVRKKRRSNR